MATMAEKYAGLYDGNIDNIPEYSEGFENRFQELLEKDTPENDNIDVEIMALQMLRGANVYKDKLGDGVDEKEQKRKAIQSMDIFVGKIKELGENWKDYVNKYSDEV